MPSAPCEIKTYKQWLIGSLNKIVRSLRLLVGIYNTPLHVRPVSYPMTKGYSAKSWFLTSEELYTILEYYTLSILSSIYKLLQCPIGTFFTECIEVLHLKLIQISPMMSPAQSGRPHLSFRNEFLETLYIGYGGYGKLRYDRVILLSVPILHQPSAH